MKRDDKRKVFVPVSSSVLIKNCLSQECKKRDALLKRFVFENVSEKDFVKGLDSGHVDNKSDFFCLGYSLITGVWSSKSFDYLYLKERSGRVLTKYKRKDEKIRPVNEGDSSKPSGDNKWLEKILEREKPTGPREEFDDWLTPKFSDIPKGSRLTEERLCAMKLPIDRLRPRELDLLIAMFYNREKVFAWDVKEKGMVIDEVEPPHQVRTVEHSPWAEPTYRLPRKLIEIEQAHVREKLDLGLFEHCWGPYRNASFFVPKKSPGKYRFVISCTKANGVTKKDAGLPPSVEEFSEGFAGYPAITVIDFFMGYEQISLHPDSRDLMAFQTSKGLMRPTTMVQGATNSVSAFVRIARKIVSRWLGKTADIFVDDVGIKGPRTTYNEEDHADLPNIRRWVFEHIINIDNVLADIERSGATIAGDKSQWISEQVSLVGYVCDKDGRHPETDKVAAILRWDRCDNQTQVRAFLGICVYYRIWVPNYAKLADPLYQLLRKDVEWEWTDDAKIALESLKIALTSPPALRTLDYRSKGKIVVTTDASLTGWGAVLQQEDPENENKRHPCRYESGVWKGAET